MRITLVNHAYADDVVDPDALLERYSTLTGWSEAVAAAGSSVSVVQRFHRDARIVRNGIEYVFREDGSGGDPRSRLWPACLHEAVLNARPDLVHVNGLDVPVQTWLLRRAMPASAALLVQDHAGRPPTFARGPLARSRLAAKRYALRGADGFMFTSAALAGPWQRAGVIGPSHRTYEVVEGSSTFQPMPRERARLKSGIAGDPAVLWVGRLHAIKDPLTVLDGFERSLARLPNARLTMVYGGGDLLPIVRERVQASHALSARVWLAGRIPHDELTAFYSAADVFVLGSTHESCGFALIEACACGAPPVVTDIAAFRAITGGGSIGRLWACGDARACAEALIAVAQQDRDESRAHARVHFEHRLSWPAVARAATQAYADLAARRRAEFA